MGNNYNILIADDEYQAIEDLQNDLNIYSKKSGISFEYITASSADETAQILSNIEKSSINLSAAFIDVDFTGDASGGKRDSGYSIIKKIFEFSPFTKIGIYSGQFRQPDLWEKYDELNRSGLVFFHYEKKTRTDREIEAKFSELFDSMRTTFYLFDIIKNHRFVTEKFINGKSFSDPGLLTDIYTIRNNFSAIEQILSKSPLFKAGSEVIYKLLITLYHQSLEAFCLLAAKTERADKKMILERAKKYEPEAAKIIDKHLEIKADSEATSLILFLAFLSPEKFRYAYKLNWLRNNAVHIPPKIDIDLLNVLFAHLAVTFCLSEKKDSVQLELIREKVDDYLRAQKNPKSNRDLSELLNFFKK